MYATWKGESDALNALGYTIVEYVWRKNERKDYLEELDSQFFRVIRIPEKFFSRGQGLIS